MVVAVSVLSAFVQDLGLVLRYREDKKLATVPVSFAKKLVQTIQKDKAVLLKQTVLIIFK